MVSQCSVLRWSLKVQLVLLQQWSLRVQFSSPHHSCGLLAGHSVPEPSASPAFLPEIWQMGGGRGEELGEEQEQMELAEGV